MTNKTFTVAIEEIVICPTCKGERLTWTYGYDSTVSALCHTCKGDRMVKCVKTYYRLEK